MPAIATKTIEKKKSPLKNKETIEELAKKAQEAMRIAEAKRKARLEKMGAELQEITVRLIAEGKLKPFNRKDIYGNL